MIFAIEQFHGSGYREIAVTRSQDAAKSVCAHLRCQNQDLPVRIVEKPEAESAVLQQIKTTKERITAWPDG